MEPIINVQNIGKKYNITHQSGSYVALRDVITNAFSFSFLKKKLASMTGRKSKEAFWALKDVSFTVQKGEVIGIVGRNGAGKSTLLKILSRITPPTTGEIRITGTLGSLLEVGTGFHPELTGRENITLNGAILGMKKREIEKKFDQIVEFAGIEKFLDTPVKYYSSGMYVRLAFSVAAHLDPDILIVDEVLAVGDADFQKKCLGKMEEITKKNGRTILFVSHNMAAIRQLCKRCILLENGSVKMIGGTEEVLEAYMNERLHGEHRSVLKNRPDTEHTIFKDVHITNSDDSEIIRSNEKLKVTLSYDTKRTEPIVDGRVVITIVNEATQQTVLMLDSFVSSLVWNDKLQPKGTIICETESSIDITEGSYGVSIDFIMGGNSVDYIRDATSFSVISDIDLYGYKNTPDRNTVNRLIRHRFTALP